MAVTLALAVLVTVVHRFSDAVGKDVDRVFTVQRTMPGKARAVPSERRRMWGAAAHTCHQ
jgi:hypothetical protein